MSEIQSINPSLGIDVKKEENQQGENLLKADKSKMSINAKNSDVNQSFTNENHFYQKDLLEENLKLKQRLLENENKILELKKENLKLKNNYDYNEYLFNINFDFNNWFLLMKEWEKNGLTQFIIKTNNNNSQFSTIKVYKEKVGQFFDIFEKIKLNPFFKITFS